MNKEIVKKEKKIRKRPRPDLERFKKPQKEKEKEVQLVDGWCKYIYEWGIFRLCVYVNKEWFHIYHHDSKKCYFYCGENQILFSNPFSIQQLVDFIYENMKEYYKEMSDKGIPIDKKWK